MTRSEAAKQRTYWTEAQLERMRELAESGLSIRLAAKELGRTPAAVAVKASVLGITFHGGKGGAPIGNKNGRGRRTAPYVHYC